MKPQLRKSKSLDVLKDRVELGKSKLRKVPPPDVSLPDDVRRAFAARIWVLLAMQMVATLIVAAAVDRIAPDSTAGHDREEEGYDELMSQSTGFFIWLLFAALCFASLGVLRAYKHRVPTNFIILGACLPIFGCFWGAAKYFLIATFSLHLLAIVTASLLLSACWWAAGLAQKLGAYMTPSKGKAQAKLEKTEDKPAGSMSTDGDPAMQAKVDLFAKHEGLARATVFLAFVNWFIASAFDFFFLKDLLQDDTSDSDNLKASVYGVIIGLFMIVWFHGDAIWHIRRCNVDNYLDLIIDVNTDIFTGFIALFAFMIALCVGEHSDPTGGADASAGGMEGGMEGGVEGGVEGGAEGGDAGGGEAQGRLPMGEGNIEGPKRNPDEGMTSV